MNSGCGRDRDISAAALSYAARGWSVVPIEARGKRPIVAWQELQRRASSAEELSAWFDSTRGVNVGIVTGVLSGLVVLDVDPGHGGEASLAKLERAHGPLPVTVEAVTGGGGRHLYFKHPDSFVHNKVGLMAGIDLRGDGGCVVAPPSVHASGRRYTWATGRSPNEISLAPLPDWLRRLIVPHEALPGHPVQHWRHLVRVGIGEGERNNTIASLAGHLLWHNVDPLVTLELLLAWNKVRCRPPLDDDEVARTVDSIARRHAERATGAIEP